MSSRISKGWCFGAALLAALISAASTGSAREKPRAPLLPLRVAEHRLVNNRKQPVVLRGVNAASMEWSSDGEGHILNTVETAIDDWHVNIVRLPLAQDRWFGRAPEQSDEGTAYRDLVKRVVEACSSRGCYILLDLHWSDAEEWGKQIGQHKMPDANSVTLWKSLAAIYKNNPAVLFDLYNEPHDVSWEVWRHGGMVTEMDRKTGTEKSYHAVGMQELLDAVRSTGARNVAVAGGLNWSYDFDGILAGGGLADPKGNGVVYSNHTYPFKGESVAAWIARVEKASQKLPVIVSEFGSDPRGGAGLTGEEWVREVLQALGDHHWSWIAWDLHPAAGPTLISDWNFKPTPQFGKWVREALRGTLPAYTPPAVVPSAATRP